MKLLVLGVGFHPEVTALSPYNTDLCRYLVNRGHDVTAVVAFPHYPEWKKSPAYRGRFFAREEIDDIKVIRVPMYIPRRPTPLRRIAYDSSYAASALVAGGLFGGHPDVIFAMCSPLQAGGTAAMLGLVHRAPFVFHIQDLLPEGAVALGMLRNPAAIKMAQMLARFIYGRASQISAIGPGFIEALQRSGVPAEKLVYLPNWVDIEWIRPLSRMNQFRTSVGAGADDFLVMYVGNFGYKQQMETVVEAAHRLRDQRHVKFVLVGDGARKEAAVKVAETYRLDNVTFLGVQPRELLPDMLAAGDLHVLHQRTEVVDMVVPSKLLTYSASARPIVLAGVPESEGARFVTDAGGGWVVQPEDPEVLAAAIAAMDRSPEERRQMAAHARSYVETHFRRERILERAEALLCEAAARS